jgi:hypothetical protein
MAKTAATSPTRIEIATGSANGCTIAPMKAINETKAKRRTQISKLKRFTKDFLEIQGQKQSYGN